MTNQERMQYERDLLTKNLSLSLIGARSGDRMAARHDPSKNIEGVSDMSTQLNYHGGYFQQNRQIKDKRKSLEKALYYSYQGAWLKKLYPKGKGKPIRGLINPNKLKQDYDDKLLSIGFEAEFAAGDIFEWVGTETHWLVVLQQLTELAYFRGEIRRCSYEIFWNDEGKEKSTFAAVRGPVETKIDYIQKHGVSIDTPNHSLSILMPKNEDTLKQFKRYSKFYLANTVEEQRICWRVEATDSISTPGILEITAVEYYSNEFEDDVEKGIVGGLIKPIEDPNEQEDREDSQLIIGKTFIKPKTVNTYEFDGSIINDWRIEGNKGLPIRLALYEDEPQKVDIEWLSSYSGQFDLYYGDEIYKTIVVESLF